MVPMARRCAFLTLAGLAMAAAIPSAAPAQEFPTRPVTMIVPWTAGSSTDAALRVIADAAGKHLGKSVVVENKPGTAGVRGAISLANEARPDGYTIAQMPQTVFRYPFTSKVSFDPLKDFTYIIGLTGYSFGVVVRADAPWKTFKEFVDHAKANPGKVNYGTPGTHTSLHIVMMQLGEQLGIDWVHVPYKGGAETTKALLAGDVMAVADASGWRPQVESGEFRLLVTWGKERMAAFPNVPTLQELGYGIVMTSPYGLAGPKGMDPKVVKTLHDAFKKALEDKAVLTVLDNLGQQVEYLSSEQYAAGVKENMEREKALVTKLGLAPS
jgi:tripartite-type tricarboxylate transporter receptor subunit TctC